MAIYPIFGVKTLLMLVIPMGLAAIILAMAGKRGISVFKKQGAAWGLTLLMVFAAVSIGYAKAPVNNPKPDLMPGLTRPPISSVAPPSSADSYVWDNARVLSSRTVRELDQRNEKLWEYCKATVGVVTCNYGGDDLYDYAMQCAEDMGLGGYDMIVVLDIQGDNYWLLQGDDIRRDFTDNDCSDYACDYMEDFFARGMYDDALLDLTEALEAWYGNYYR